jgi:NAD+ synthase
MLEDYPELEEDFYIKYLAKLPADGLTGKSDEENFGFTYLDLTNYMTTGTSGNPDIDEKIKTLHTTSEHKLNMPYTLLEPGKLID